MESQSQSREWTDWRLLNGPTSAYDNLELRKNKVRNITLSK